MTLETRTPMRRCGKPYATREAALASKRAQADGVFVPEDPCRCESFHVAKGLPPVVLPVPAPRTPADDELPADRVKKTGARKSPRYTGPNNLTRLAVLKRDGLQCVRCGCPAGPEAGPYSIQHRIARGVGGTNIIQNLLLLCGSATTLCHGAVESKSDPHDLARGYRLESWQDPAAEPVMIVTSPDGGGITVWLSDDGEYLLEQPEPDDDQGEA